MKTFERIISAINDAMMWVAGTLAILMGLAITYDIIMRTLFKAPAIWAFEFSNYLCAAVAFLAGGYTLKGNRHVNVDVLYRHFAPRNKALANLSTSFLFFLVCGVLMAMGSITAFESFQSKATSGGGWDIPLFLPQLLVPVGGLLLGLQGVIRWAQDWQTVRGKKQEGG
jgi:TRAP-type mannitol/chloroaromatic compound transport system permease small subunit